MGERRNKAHVPVRLNTLFFVVFILFSALILRLGIVQIVQGEEYQEQLERTINISSPVEAPRGLIYDRNGNVVVDNELQMTVTYTNRRTSMKEMLEVARELNTYITIEQERINERDIKDYWLVLNQERNEMLDLTHYDEPYDILPLDEQRELGLSENEAYMERLERITEEHLGMITDEGMEVFHIWREFIAGFNYLPHKVAQGIEYEEAARIMENMEDLPGVDIIRDSQRKYPYGDTLARMFGNTGSIPRERVDEFLANGYTRNESVGTSYLEAQYESVLRGRNGSLDNHMNRQGDFLRNPEVNEGSRGNDLILSIDMELQQRVEEAIEKELSESARHFIEEEDAYVVMMDPNTGEVLSMAGHNNNELGNVLSGFEVGSSMKGASVLIGYETGVFSHGEQIVDRPIQLPGEGVRPVRSHRPLGRINDIQALEQSSNIYMAEIALRLSNYIPQVSNTWGDYHSVYDLLRYHYAQFGLGVETGIDLPNEATGYGSGIYGNPGNMLFLTFGQYDTYTPMQLAQHVSVIANGGYRIAPRIVSEIREPGRNKHDLGPLVRQNDPKVLNKIPMSDQDLARVQEGFRQVMHGSQGTARSFFGDLDYKVAGKTGTAQRTIEGEAANNQTLVGYAPYDDPEVAFAIVVPGVSTTHGGVANRIGVEIMEAYFELKEGRSDDVDESEMLFEEEFTNSDD
ncbi:penicillin-binding transpeptidase domain-containing protein [Alteribacter aurantiacus]|uniref:penicillin-binding transpeptidase domain-containing protein n=1 Tax=Alteribacter aurantiacus TaxID=254410 RepID=UPI00041E5E03|nr:penicillin-binding transpeptidase domain-containing protein [Alteribacter aurantiacus]